MLIQCHLHFLRLNIFYSCSKFLMQQHRVNFLKTNYLECALEILELIFNLLIEAILKIKYLSYHKFLYNIMYNQKNNNIYIILITQ